MFGLALPNPLPGASAQGTGSAVKRHAGD